MRTMLIFSALLATPLAAQTVQVGEGDWRNIPMLEKNASIPLGQRAMKRIDSIVGAGQCPAIGRRNAVAMALPFIVEFNPDKSVASLIVKRIGCPDVEQIAASVALYAAKTGEIVPSGKNDAGWYRGEVSYYLE